jgi:hypothetical protein
LDKAYRYLREAGAKPAARTTYRDAVSYFEQALAALGHLPQDHATLEQAIEIRRELRNAFGPLGEHARMHDVLREGKFWPHRLAIPVGSDRYRLIWHTILSLPAKLKRVSLQVSVLSL